MCQSKSQGGRRCHGAPAASGGMSPAFAAMTADDPSFAEGSGRLRATRAGGYTGPVDQHGNRVTGTGPARRGDQALAPMQAQMREWRARLVPEPSPAAPMDPQLAKALGCDTPEGLERYERGRAYREAGYTGPLDTGNRIPDPDDPANREALHALAALSETSS